MKETKITKRIFAVFVAFIVILLISCGDLHVFAENVTIVVYRDFASQGYFTCYKGNSLVYDRAILSGPNNFSLQTDIVYKCLVYHVSAGVRVKMFVNNVTELSIDPSNPTVITPNDVLYGSNYSTGSNSTYYYFKIVTATPTPEPTPTPVPTPTPEPTFNPDHPTYTTFFNHLLNDGNNALNALYLSWTSANNKFYTGIFFIGLPIMIGIFGIVASIFFGGDD